MGKNKLLLLLLLCLLLTACGRDAGESDTPAPPPVEEQDTARPGDKDDPGQPEDPARSISLDHLTVELVADWEDSDALLSRLDELSQLLQGALAAQSCEVEAVNVTISTAGGFTGEALVEGGVDIACLPAVDYAACESGVSAVLTTDEAVPSSVIAVTAARKALDRPFLDALAAALTESEAGEEFLSICHPGETFVPAEEETLRALLDWAAGQETEGAD